MSKTDPQSPDHPQAELPFAVVKGEPITVPPEDLYIPPDALEISWTPSRARWTCCCT